MYRRQAWIRSGVSSNKISNNSRLRSELQHMNLIVVQYTEFHSFFDKEHEFALLSGDTFLVELSCQLTQLLYLLKKGGREGFTFSK